MKNTDLLNVLMKFNDRASERRVVLTDKKLISEYKKESNADLETVNNVIADLGFNYIYVVKDIDKSNNKSAYAISANGKPLFDILNDIEYRCITYTTIRKKISIYMNKFTEDEIVSFISIATKLLSELMVTEIDIDCLFDISEEQRKLYSKDSIFTCNNIFIPYILNELEAHKKGMCFYDRMFFTQLYDYLFYDTSPLEYLDFGEKISNDHIVYGLKLKEKDITLADFLEMLCCDEIVNILYKKSYGKDKSYLAESLRCTYYIALGLEIIISE